MAIQILRTLDMVGTTRITNLPDAASAQEPATLAQLNAAVEGLAWKDSCRVSTQGNTNLASPGATIDGITMATSDRVLVRLQTADEENGIYIWNGAATPMTRALDMSVAAEFESAVTTVEEGTNAGVSYRQTQVNITVGTDDVLWTVFGSGAGSASESSAGIAEIATQGETDTGTDDARFVTPLKLATSVYASRKFTANIGDGSATSYTVTHNLGTRDVDVAVYRNSGNYDEVGVEIQHATTNTVVIVFDVAPTSNQFRVKVST